MDDQKRRRLSDELQAEVARADVHPGVSAVDQLIAERRMESRAEHAWLSGGDEAEHAVRREWFADEDRMQGRARDVEATGDREAADALRQAWYEAEAVAPELYHR
jgi:hypothetical protein